MRFYRILYGPIVSFVLMACLVVISRKTSFVASDEALHFIAFISGFLVSLYYSELQLTLVVLVIVMFVPIWFLLDFFGFAVAFGLGPPL